MYAVPTDFVLMSVVGRKDALQDIQEWTPEELMRITEARPEITELICRGSKENVLLYCCRAVLSEGEDFDFESDEFIRMLQFTDREFDR